MKRFLASLGLLSLLLPHFAFAAYGLTQSASLDGSTLYATRADTASLSIVGNMTLEGWFKLSSLPADGTVNALIEKGSALTDSEFSFQIVNPAGGGADYQLRLRTRQTNGGAINSTAFVAWSADTGVWHHLAVTYNTSGASNVNFYVDGVLQGTTQTDSHTALLDSNNTWYLSNTGGNLSTAGQTALYSLVRVWSSERSAANILANKCLVLGATSNLAAEWTLNNTLNDNSGNTNTLTNVGTFTYAGDVPSVCQSAASSPLYLAFLF